VPAICCWPASKLNLILTISFYFWSVREQVVRGKLEQQRRGQHSHVPVGAAVGNFNCQHAQSGLVFKSQSGRQTFLPKLCEKFPK